MGKMEYSVGLVHAWNIEAAGVAGEDNHKYIQKDHIFIGICSLLEENPASVGEKYELKPKDEKLLRAEVKVIKDLLGEFKLDSTKLGYRVREMLGRGSYEHKAGANGKITISRDKTCKEKVFPRAEGLASSEVNCLHFLAALLDEPDSKTVHVLDRAGVNLKALKERATACAYNLADNKAFVGTGGRLVDPIVIVKEETQGRLQEMLTSCEKHLKSVFFFGTG